MMYADGPNKPRADEFDRSKDKQSQKQRSPTKGKDAKKVNYPDLADTASSPSKSGTREMQVDPPARKRLAMDSSGLELPNKPDATLALTQGLGEDGDATSSPCNSSNSKKARIDYQGFSDEKSAASFEEDRRVQ